MKVRNHENKTTQNGKGQKLEMNEHAILHMPDSKYCFPVGEQEVIIRLRMAREDQAAKVSMIHACKYEFHEKRQKTQMEIKYTDRLYHYYEIRLKLSDVRLAYVFEIENEGRTYYFCEDGLTEQYNFEEGFYNFFQLPYINANDVMPVVDWMKRAVFYQIFVDRFYMGNQEKDKSYINMRWEEKPTPKSFAGGDIRGIIEKLDYLKELGITAIYLTPIFQSISNHKYDTIDYMTIDTQFGTKEDFAELVKKAHDRNIRIVLDAVFNHCSMQMRQFADVMEKGSESKYYEWFLIDGDYPEPEKCNYECFAACNYMPKLNTANENVQEFLIQIALYWIKEFDIDGWRLDVSDEISHVFWRKFREAVKKEKSDAVIIGENWHDAYPYLQGEQYDSIMNYAFTKACLDYFARDNFNARQMAEKLNANLMRNTEQVNKMMLNLLDSHDTHRFFTEVKKDKDRLLAAVALTMIFPGAPCMYYGTEICLEGGYDPDSRRGFYWDETKWDKSVMEKIRELTHLRVNEAIAEGDVRIYENSQMLVVERGYAGECLKLMINLTKETQRMVIKTGNEVYILSQNHATIHSEACGTNADGAECQSLQADTAVEKSETSSGKHSTCTEVIVEKTGFAVIREGKPVA